MIRSAASLTAVFTTALLLAACGGGDDGDSPARSAKGGTPKKPVASGEGIDLDIELAYTLENIGGKDDGAVPVPERAACTKSSPATCTGKLSCPTIEGAPEDEYTLCAWFAREGAKLLAAQADDQVCTMIYGGPETGTLTGTFDGVKVNIGLSRNDGCAIARWESLEPLWTGQVPAG